jgi:hypothetical protein
MAKKKAAAGAETPAAAPGSTDPAAGAVKKPRAPRKNRAAAADAPVATPVASTGLDVPAPAPVPLAATPDAGTPRPEPVPLAVPLEEQITGLPPLVYPGSDNAEFDHWAAEKRRNRVRVEVVGGALLLIAGVVVTIISGRPAFVAVALFGVVGLVAYEFLVTSFE